MVFGLPVSVGGAVTPEPSLLGWKELGRVTSSGGETSLSVTGLPAKRYYMVLYHIIPQTSSLSYGLRFNGDAGGNYAARFNSDGGADSSAASTNQIDNSIGSATLPFFGIYYISNLPTKEKLVLHHEHYQNTAGATTASNRGEAVGKWANTSASTNRIDIVRVSGTGTLASGSQMVILGWDPHDRSSTNFWTELASVESTGDTLTASITAKKYLWVQAMLVNSGTLDTPLLRLGNSTVDEGTNYSWRKSTDGTSEATAVSQTSIQINGFSMTHPFFINTFLINASAREKLVILHCSTQNTAGATTAPRRTEIIGKWTNTSNQADQIQIVDQGTGSFGSGSILKVWGAD